MKKPSTNPTLDAVALKAGVSKMTASRALRNVGRVSAETRQRVLAAAEALGYRPNPMVQSFMASVRRKSVEHSANLAWVVTGKAAYNLARPLIEQGACERAHELGFGFDEILVNQPGVGVAQVGRMLKARGVVGALIAPLISPGTVDFPWDQLPSVAISRSLTSPSLHYVMAHFYHMMDRAVAEMLARGYRRIGFLNTREMDARSEHAPLSRFALPADTDENQLTFVSAFCDNWGDRQIKDWINTNRLDAVIGIYAAIQGRLTAAGIKSPKDIGFLSLSWFESYPQSAGIRHPWEAIGAGAVDMVVAQLHRNERGIPARPKAMLFDGDWVEGATLRPRLKPAGAL